MKKQYLKPVVVSHKLLIDTMILGVSTDPTTTIKKGSAWGNKKNTDETLQAEEDYEDGIESVEGDDIFSI